jgi:hypothetical protein
MHRSAASILTLTLLAALAACGTPTAAPASPTGPSVGATAAAATIGPSSSPSAETAVLLRGMRLDLQDRCAPSTTGLPTAAVAGVTCKPAGAAVDAASVFLFDTQATMLEAYAGWLEGHSLRIADTSPGCGAGSNAESAWLPDGGGGAPLAERGACQVGLDGRVRGAITLPPFVLVTYEGPATDPVAVARWAWLGNKDQPGSPTVWNGDGPMSPEK